MPHDEKPTPKPLSLKEKLLARAIERAAEEEPADPGLKTVADRLRGQSDR